MEANAWWLIAVPVLFGLGWAAARIDAAQWFTKTKQLPQSYFKGLNYLLAEQHEPAIAAFEEVARLDPETAELYFALGSLFRRRGETERAIRIHRNLLERADLPEAQRQQALFCLAQDYLIAGIFDRAETAFSALADTAYAGQAQRELAKLYEKENNWQAAITGLKNHLAISQLSSSERNQVQEDLSHYACELAMQHIEGKDFAAAQVAMAMATDNAPQNPRIAIHNAQLNFLLNHPEQAYQQLERAVITDANLAAIAIHTVLTYALDKPSGLNSAARWAKAYPSADTIKQVFNALLKTADRANADCAAELLQLLALQLKRPPVQLAAAHVLLANSSLASDTHTWIQPALSAIESLINRYDKPTCSQCGFKASRHHWRCPGCARWNTLPYTAAAAN